jgi:hypothetical protein
MPDKNIPPNIYKAILLLKINLKGEILVSKEFFLAWMNGELNIEKKYEEKEQKNLQCSLSTQKV